MVRTWDEALARASGIAASDAIGRPLAAVIPSLVERGLLSRFEEVVGSGAVHVFSPAIHRYLLPCPPTTPSSRFDQMQQRATAGPLREGDRITGVFVTIEDVTARIDAERDLAQSLSTGDTDWTARRAAVQRLSPSSSSDFAVSLVEVVRTHHRDFDVLSSALQLLAGTDVDVSPVLADLLNDADADLRIQAALALGGYATPAAEQALIGALSDPETNVRFQAIESLGRIRSTAAVDRLAELAEQGDAFVAFAAVDALAAIGDPKVTPRLVPLLASDELSGAVAETLGALGSEEVVEPLVNLANRSAPAARPVVAALDRIFNRLEATFGEGQLVIERAGASMTPAGETHVATQAATASDEDLPGFARVLGWLQRPEAHAALFEMLARPAAREHALAAIVARGSLLVPRLVTLVGDERDELARTAIKALGMIGSRDATRALLTALERPPLVGAAAGALARLGDPAAFESLLQLLAHPEAGVRQTAIGALNGMSHPALAERVCALLSSDDANLRESAVRIAGYFGYAEAAARVLTLADDPVEAVRCAVVEHLPYFDHDAATPRLLASLEHETADVRAAAARALAHVPGPLAHDALVRALHDEWWWVRYYAARSLGEHRRREAIEALAAAAVADAVPPVRVACVEALGVIAPDESAVTLRQLANDDSDDVAAAALYALSHVRSSEIATVLLAAARDPRRAIQMAAARALGALDDREAVAALQSLAALGADHDVRRAAIESLGAAAMRPSAAGDGALDALASLVSDQERGPVATAALARFPITRLIAFGRLLQHPSVATRRIVVQTIGRYSAIEATTLLMDALADEAPLVREAAARMLERRRDTV